MNRAAPGYLRLVTGSNFWPFLLMHAMMSLVLLIMILLVYALTSSPEAAAENHRPNEEADLGPMRTSISASDRPRESAAWEEALAGQ